MPLHTNLDHSLARFAEPFSPFPISAVLPFCFEKFDYLLFIWRYYVFQAPEGETQPSTEVDLFISTEKIMVLNTDLKVRPSVVFIKKYNFLLLFAV